jgi:thioredoxin reductase (NADPH)
MTGWRADPGRYARSGVTVDEETGIPAHDPETMETNVPGLYIAGVIAAGNNANKIFIENGREHGELIVAHHSATTRGCPLAGARPYQRTDRGKRLFTMFAKDEPHR